MTPPTVPPATAEKASRAETSAASSSSQGPSAVQEASPPQDGTLPLVVLAKRSDFLAAARARRQAAGSFMLQGRRRAEDEGPAPAQIRMGFTCSKKVGNAVARNRAKRRLREAARAMLPHLGRPGWDYVLIGRADQTAARPFELLKADLEQALTRMHAPRAPRPDSSRPEPSKTAPSKTSPQDR
ncbi:ribonuclease P protein component [Oceanicola sp. S124]|uniref:ribonuclease P protein component n=1 Tax=Oceanicola sp. S124 TaxID=1042378 RepID=UPI000A001AD5|nr:ribonuclease P protein component [Oceanicola sp. S124]